MTIEESELKGLFIIKPGVFQDERGYFFEAYNKAKFNEKGLNLNFVQDNISRSRSNVLRGLHFQEPPGAQGKLVNVLSGSVLDVVVDIRVNSPTYGQHITQILSAENKLLLYISEGFAHGFLTLEDNTIFAYKCTSLYNPALEKSLNWSDPDLGINWNSANPILTLKDKSAMAFSELKSKFII